MRTSNVALLQLCSGDNIRANLAQIEQQIKQLKPHVKLVMTPENALLFSDTQTYYKYAETEGNGSLQNAISEMAIRYGVWILIGSMPLVSKEDPNRLTTSSLLFDGQGEIKARYDKLHLFDVEVADSHGYYRESDTYSYGKHITVVDTPVGRLGMTICYDLRFPGLFQALRTQGAEIISIPAAFTRVTGEAHWEVLLRARAIENQCWVLAPAQIGRHGTTRRTWGHTMAIDPWGTVVGLNADAVEVTEVHVDTSGMQKIRKQMPIAQHNRFQPMLTNSQMKSE